MNAGSSPLPRKSGREGLSPPPRDKATAAVSCSRANAPPGIEIQQRPRVSVLRVTEHFARQPVLHDLAILHDRDEIADLRGHAQVMRDEDDRAARAAPQFRKQLQHLRLHGNIERRHRLVRHQHVRLQRQRPRQADALRAGRRRIRAGSGRRRKDRVRPATNSSFASAIACARGVPWTIGPCATSSAALRRGLRKRTGPETPSGYAASRGERLRASSSPSRGPRARSPLCPGRSAARCSAPASICPIRIRRRCRASAPRGRLSETFFTAGVTRAPRPGSRRCDRFWRHP